MASRVLYQVEITIGDAGPAYIDRYVAHYQVIGSDLSIINENPMAPTLGKAVDIALDRIRHYIETQEAALARKGIKGGIENG